MDSVKFQMRLSSELLGRIDESRGSVPRAAWLRRAAEMRLDPGPAASSAKTVAARAERRPARVDLGKNSEATSPVLPGQPVDKYHVMLAERQQRINRGQT